MLSIFIVRTLQCLKFFFANENMKKPASKVAEPAQMQPKSQFLFHKNLPPRDFSLMTLVKILPHADNKFLHPGYLFLHP